jgi:hypothetical protein
MCPVLCNLLDLTTLIILVDWTSWFSGNSRAIFKFRPSFWLSCLSLEPLDTAVLCADGDMYMGCWWNDDLEWKTKIFEDNFPCAILLTAPHGLPWDWAWALSVGSCSLSELWHPGFWKSVILMYHPVVMKTFTDFVLWSSRDFVQNTS